MQEYLLTMIGPDRTGMVAGLARVLARHGGNWLDSRMVRLGGTFSGLLRVELPEAAYPAFSEEAEAFLTGAGYRLTLEPGMPVDGPPEGRMITLTVSGQDHPGIVEGIFSVLGKAGANVEEMRSGLAAAPWSGTPVFEATARLRLPQSVSLDSLQDDLEAIASDLLVELQLGES
jgi:glycine cleavage system regulatory protein